MGVTRSKRRVDLEAEVIARCVKAMKLEGVHGIKRRWTSRLTTVEHKRVLKYLADRFGVTF